MPLAPNNYTTQNRYSFWAILYILTCILIYILLLAFPLVLSTLATAFNIVQLQIDQNQILRQNYPLALWLVGFAVLSSFPFLRRGEARLRTRFHRQAFIPSQAAALVTRVVNEPEPFLSEYSKAMRADNFERRGSGRVIVDTARALIGERPETVKRPGCEEKREKRCFWPLYSVESTGDGWKISSQHRRPDQAILPSRRHFSRLAALIIILPLSRTARSSPNSTS